VPEHDPEDKAPEAAAIDANGAAVHEDEALAEEEYFDDEGLDDDDGEADEYVDELGRRHVRRAAPEGTEELLENEAPRRTGLPDSVERWRQRSATGAVLTAFAFGLQQALETEKKEPAIIMVTSGDPPKDLPVEAELEQLGPRQSSVKVRTWLLPGAAPGRTPGYRNPSGWRTEGRSAKLMTGMLQVSLTWSIGSTVSRKSRPQRRTFRAG
jgi:hypothetical protein